MIFGHKLSRLLLAAATVFTLQSCGPDDTGPIPCELDPDCNPEVEKIDFDYVTYEADAVITTETHRYYDDGSSNLSLTLYNVDNSTDLAKPMVVLAPGGGFTKYNRVAEVKALANDLAHRGYATAVVLYTISQPDPATWFSAFLDMKAAIKFLKKNAADFEINPDLIFSGGWSTGSQIAIKAAHLEMDDYDAFDQSILHTILDDYVADGLEPAIYSEYSSTVKGNILLLPTSWNEDYFDSNGPAILMVGSERSTYSSGTSMWGTEDVNGISHVGGDVLFDKAKSKGYVDGDNLELHLAPSSLDAQYEHVNYTVLDAMFYDDIAAFIERNLD